MTRYYQLARRKVSMAFVKFFDRKFFLVGWADNCIIFIGQWGEGALTDWLVVLQRNDAAVSRILWVVIEAFDKCKGDLVIFYFDCDGCFPRWIIGFFL